jgi:small subunit ribosomal protein S2
MYITERWLGGLLTNFQTVKKQLRRMKELEAGSARAASGRTTRRRSV